MRRGARRVVLALATGVALGCVACTGSGPTRYDPKRTSTATTFPPACQSPPPDPAREARAKACGERDDVQRYVRDAQRAVLSAWTPPAVDDAASVLLSLQVAADGTLHDVCALDDFDSPLAPSALEAAERVKQLPKPDPAVAACLPDVRFTGLFKIKVESR